MRPNPNLPPEGFVDPLDRFFNESHFFWFIDKYLSTESIFLAFCAGALYYLWIIFPFVNKRFAKFEDYTQHARIYFLLFSKIIVVKTVIKAALLPVYGDYVRMTADESLVVFFGSLLLMGAINEPSLKDRIKKYLFDQQFDDRRFRCRIYWETIEPTTPLVVDSQSSTSPDTHSPTPHTATGAAPTPPESSS